MVRTLWRSYFFEEVGDKEKKTRASGEKINRKGLRKLNTKRTKNLLVVKSTLSQNGYGDLELIYSTKIIRRYTKNGPAGCALAVKGTLSQNGYGDHNDRAYWLIIPKI